MCLSLAIHRPNDVLATGEHLGFEWHVLRNHRGYRCGYVRVPAGHPWHGRYHNEFNQEDVDEVLEAVKLHNELSFSEPDMACDKEGEDNAWWLGFAYSYTEDLPDPLLAENSDDPEFWRSIAFDDATVKSQEFYEAECRSLCEQAAAAAGHCVAVDPILGVSGAASSPIDGLESFDDVGGLHKRNRPGLPGTACI
jgi:hypothetical protein